MSYTGHQLSAHYRWMHVIRIWREQGLAEKFIFRRLRYARDHMDEFHVTPILKGPNKGGVAFVNRKNPASGVILYKRKS